MRTVFGQVLFAAGLLGLAAYGAADCGTYFTDEEPLALDLGGATRTVETWTQTQWNAQPLAVTNGTLVFTRRVGVHGGPVKIGPQTTLRFARGCSLATGTGDAATRVFDLAPGARLEMDGIDWHMDHTRVVVPSGATWVADVNRLSLDGAMKDNRWQIGGRALLCRGISVAEAKWGHRLKVELAPGGELVVGGSVATNAAANCGLDVELAGGRLVLVWDAALAPGLVRVKSGASVEVAVAKGVAFDPAAIDVPADATLTVVRDAPLPKDLPPRYTFAVSYDRAGRSYWISADAFRDALTSLTFRYPHPDVDAAAPYLEEKALDTLFRKRFPAGKGPWTVTARLVNRQGETHEVAIPVARPAKTIRPPAPNEQVLVGHCGYGAALDLTQGIVAEDLCNLYVGWHTAAKTHPDAWTNVSETVRAQWAQTFRDRRMWSMSIYGADGPAVQARLSDAYEGRYLGNNIGEYASFMYQARENCGIPMDLDLDAAKVQFVNRYCGKAGFGWMADVPGLYSTCGAALSCYELAGGIDFICNEQWAIGAQNLAHTSAEARGAARKWGPEYWCAWNAHEWQTCSVPYRTDQKYASCLVGYFEEYIAGTSLIVLESGAQGKQAWQYTADEAGQPKEARAKEGYDGEVARRYRAVTKQFYDWVKDHPRAPGTPESKIALALGNLDAYLGQDGAFTVWSQHDRAAKDPVHWRYGAAERTQALAEDIFFPRPADALAPYPNNWVGGTPYGQVDVMQIDDESTLADLARYALVVFGGWNTMTEPVKDLLERYVRAGGTLVLARPHLTTRVDRRTTNEAPADVRPLFGLLPPIGPSGAYVEHPIGKGRYFLFTAPEFPAATAAGRSAYRALVTRLAGAVEQTVRLVSDNDDVQRICYGVYGTTAYFLNTDTVHSRTFTYTRGPHRQNLTLAPCEIKIVTW